MNQTEADDLAWFHAIDFGDVQTPGRIAPSQPPNWTLFGVFSFLEHIDLVGASVVDLGTMDGLSAFAMKGLGATEVVATDLWDRQQFRLGRTHLGWDDEVEYHTGLDIEQAPAVLGSHRFDAMVFAGVLYHLMSPLNALIQCRLLLKEQGLMLLETCFDAEGTGSSMLFNQGMADPVFNEPTTYFLPTLEALLAMMRSAAFAPVAWMQLGSSNRVSVLARACRPSEVPGKTPLQQTHDRYVSVRNHFAFGDTFYSLEQGEGGRSSITLTDVPEGGSVLDVRAFRPTVPYQPRWDPDA